MGCLAVCRPVILTHPWPTSPNFTSLSVSPNFCGYRIATARVRDFGFRRPYHNQLNCYHRSSSENEQEPHQDAILKVISEISKGEGRIGRTTTMVLGGTMANDSTYDALSLTKMGGRVGESSYGEEAASDQQYGEGNHDRGISDRRLRDDRDHESGYERDLPREKDAVQEDEWFERRHRNERDRDRDRERERSRDRDRERSRDRGRDRHSHKDERDRYADHRRYREVEPEYDDEWDRGRSSRAHGKSRLAQEDEHRSRSRDADYGKRRRAAEE